MKLLFCTACLDVIALRQDFWRQCYCGKSEGRYISERKAMITGPSLCIGIDNNSLLKVVTQRIQETKDSRKSTPIDAFLIEAPCKTIIYKDGEMLRPPLGFSDRYLSDIIQAVCSDNSKERKV